MTGDMIAQITFLCSFYVINIVLYVFICAQSTERISMKLDGGWIQAQNRPH